MAWLTGWLNRRAITIDHTKVDAALVDFPVLLKLQSILPNGSDTRFTASDGVTLLKFDRVRWDAATEMAEFYVKVPSVSASADTVIYMYYNNPSAEDGADPANVWDAGFEAVWHMHDATTSTVADSTTNAHTGTKKAANEPIEALHRLGLAQDFDGTNDYIAISDSLVNLTADFSVDFWVSLDPTQISINSRMLTLKDATTNLQLFVYLADGRTGYRLSSSSFRTAGAALTFDNTWHHVAFVLSGGAKYMYVDGALLTVAAGGVSAEGSYSHIGGGYSLSSYLTRGSIDEVRLSAVSRSSAWVKADYHSGNCSLLTVGEEETDPYTHVILSAVYSEGSPELNRAFVVGTDAAGAQVFGSAVTQAEVDLVGERMEAHHDSAIPTSAVAAAVSAAMLEKARLDGKRAELVIPPHCGLEPWDVLAVLDTVANQDTLYRVAGYELEYDMVKGTFLHRLKLCDV